MKIAYINDQVFPCSDTDCEQIMQTVSTMGQNGVNISFIIPSCKGKDDTNPQILSEFYQVKSSFSLFHVKSVFPAFRFIEKTAHAIVSVMSDETKKCAVIYTRNLPTVITALMFTNKPVFYETYRNWPDQLFFMGWLFRRFNKCRNFMGTVTHSEFASESYIRAGVDSSKILTKMNGYDPGRIKPVLSKDAAREKLGLPTDKTIVTYAGNISPGKGLGIVLDLAQANKDTYFILAGSKKQTPIEKRAADMKNVLIVPWLKFDKVVEYLYASDILILPPTTGPLEKVGNTVLPIKTFLYMACSRVILGPESPDLKQILINDINAKLVQPDSFEKADAGLKELVAMPELREKLAKKAYDDVKECTYIKRSLSIIDFIREKTQFT